jgi:CubicO group peptidase (beta-lactamase class C family)
MIVEARSGLSFSRFLRERILEPAGMHRSLAFQNGGPAVPERAYGYTVEQDSVWLSDQSSTSAVLGDGGVYSSINDLAAWDRALRRRIVLPADVLEAMWKPAVWIVPDSLAYGMGWRIDWYRGHRRVHHTGSTSGFRNVIQRYPDDGFTIVILTNRRDPDVAPIADALADLYVFGL